MRTLKAGAVYFALVFAAGFVLGPIRVLWLVPRLGERTAELLELPVMLVVIVLAARWVVRRFALAPIASDRLATGGIALALMLLAELTLVLWLRGLTLAEYFAGRDPVAAAAYYAALLVFALMPMIICRR